MIKYRTFNIILDKFSETILIIDYNKRVYKWLVTLIAPNKYIPINDKIIEDSTEVKEFYI